MGREFELKYRATPQDLEEIQKEYPNFTPITMETTYYDTPSGIFSQRRWTLRRRMENGVSVCTLKADLCDGSRGEWETECTNILESVPHLIAIGAPAKLAELVHDGIIPTCGARFTRLAATVPAGSSIVEIALDSGILTGGNREKSLCEVEVELKKGTDSEAIRFAESLAARHSLIPEPKSKLRRALALAQK